MASFGQLSKQAQMNILGVLLLVMCALFYLYMISPISAELNAIEMEIDGLNREIEQAQIVQVQLTRIKSAVADQEARLAELREVLPDEKETAEIMLQVQQLAVSSDLKIRSFTPRPTVNNVFYEEWPILISLEGNYHNLGSFFERISGFTRIINIEDLNIQAVDENSTRERSLSATCTATTFVFIENPTPVEETS